MNQPMHTCSDAPGTGPHPAGQPDRRRLPVVLVLASGRGERFRVSGGQVHKLQADLLGRTVLERTLAAVQESGLRWHLEDAGHPGMGDSIAAAVRACDSECGWLVLPADLPLVRAQTLWQMATAAMTGEVLVPVHAGVRGHPVRFAPQCGPALRQLQGSQGAASIVAQARVERIEVDDEGCVLDIDTLDDLQRAREVLLRRNSGGQHA